MTPYLGLFHLVPKKKKTCTSCVFGWDSGSVKWVYTTPVSSLHLLTQTLQISGVCGSPCFPSVFLFLNHSQFFFFHFTSIHCSFFFVFDYLLSYTFFYLLWFGISLWVAVIWRIGCLDLLTIWSIWYLGSLKLVRIDQFHVYVSFSFSGLAS